MGSANTGNVGASAEQAAFNYLVTAGLRPVTRNFHCRLGEIDLVMLDDDCLVFVEVRFRATSAFLHPALTVDRHKQARLVRTAAMFMARHRQFGNVPVRFDVVAITGAPEPDIDWIRDAFRPADSTL